MQSGNQFNWGLGVVDDIFPRTHFHVLHCKTYLKCIHVLFLWMLVLQFLSKYSKCIHIPSLLQKWGAIY
jgi:hypothetical protein